jgi:hypothetical protein
VEVESLHIKGAGLEEALWWTSLRPVALGEVEARLAVAHPALWQQYTVGEGGEGGGGGGGDVAAVGVEGGARGGTGGV